MNKPATLVALFAVMAAVLGPIIAQGQCGTTVYDTGGPGGNYGILQNLTWTYCAPPGQVVTITFTAFNTEAGFDELSVHDGPTNAAPMLGIFSGTALPPSITGSVVGGCITLWFTSDLTVNAPGWAANITCAPPPPPPAGDCVYQLEMFDSFGDGWDGSTVGISINGGPITTYTIGGSYGSALIGLFIGDVIVVQYTELSPWPGEISYSLGFSGGTAVFNSGSPPATGIVFTQTIDCNPPPSPPEDCLGAITICSGQSFNNNTQNTGNEVDLNASNYGCLASAERQGTWYTFSPATGGQVGLTLAPLGPDDYDFALWGPYPPGSTTATLCPPVGPPIRCSYASGPTTFGATGSYDTGMGSPIYSPPQWANPAPAVSENALGDGWVSGMNVVAGQVYLMYISNWDQTGLAFSLSWTLAGGATLDCTVLPIELLTLEADVVNDHVRVHWVTGSEQGSDRFIIERSPNGGVFSAIGEVDAAGNSVEQTDYVFVDGTPIAGTNFYRLRQLDLDGSVDQSDVVSVVFQPDGVFVSDPYPVPAGDMIALDIFPDCPGPVHISITDLLGRTIYDRTLAAGEGEHVEIPCSSWRPGLYGIEVIAANGAPLKVARWVKR